MSELRIIFTILIFFGVLSLLYWKRHWIDKELQKTWAILILLMSAIASFLAISIFLEFLFDERPMDWENLMRIYGVFSQTSSAYSPPNGTAIDYIYNLLLSILGAFLFAGLLISAFNNMLAQRIWKVKEGLVDYDFSNHIVIVGANDSLLTIIRSIIGRKGWEKSKILIVTSKNIDELYQIRDILGNKVWNQIYYIKANILSVNEDDVGHYLKRSGIRKCHELYVLSDSKPSECDIDNTRIIYTIYKYISHNGIDRKSDHIDCYMSYSNLAMTIRICRDLEKIKVESGKNVFKIIRLIPFDVNMIFAAKAIYSKKLPTSIDIVGLSDIAIGLIKVLLLTSHNIENESTVIKIYYTKKELEIKHWFELTYDFKSIKDINLRFIEIEDSSSYVITPEKSSFVALCYDNLDINIKIAYAIQRSASHQDVFVYSKSPSLNGVFTDNKGEKSEKIKAFGETNQSIAEALSEMKNYTIKFYQEFCDLKDSEKSSVDFQKYQYSFDHLKWRLLSLAVFNNETLLSEDIVLKQQFAATILGGYIISDSTDFNTYNVSTTNIEKFLPVIIKILKNDNDFKAKI